MDSNGVLRFLFFFSFVCSFVFVFSFPFFLYFHSSDYSSRYSQAIPLSRARSNDSAWPMCIVHSVRHAGSQFQTVGQARPNAWIITFHQPNVQKLRMPHSNAIPIVRRVASGKPRLPSRFCACACWTIRHVQYCTYHQLVKTHNLPKKENEAQLDNTSIRTRPIVSSCGRPDRIEGWAHSASLTKLQWWR